MKSLIASSLSALAASALFLTTVTNSANAADLTWDTAGGDGSTVTAGSGAWNTTAGNTVWNNAGTNVIWNQALTTDGSNTATFAGTDGTTDQYTITLAAQMAAESITFNSSGYNITGSTLALMPTTNTNGAITVSAGKTATINSILRYVHNTGAAVTVNSGGTLNLGGGTVGPNLNPQFNFSGAGTINLTGGTFTNNVGTYGNAVINLTGGTHAITPGTNVGGNISSNTQNVAYNLNGGTLTVNGNSTTQTNSLLGIGNGTTTAFTSTLNVISGTMNVGTTASTAGEIRISGTAASNGTLNVSGGTVTVGTGKTDNKIYFFKSGADAGYTANMTQSGGTVTANGIQFGGTSGTYSGTSSANLTLTSGALYVGLQGITSGSAASALPIAIKLQGGTIGASDSWSSSLNMKLGATSGGPVFQAATSNGTSKNITLSGVLSDDASVNGTLTKTGAGTLTLSGSNTFSGGLNIKNGTVNATTSDGVLGSGTVSMGGAGSSGATLTIGRTFANNFTINAPDSGSVLIAANGDGSKYTLTGSINLNGNLTLQSFDTPTSSSGTASGTIKGGITGAGNLVLNNLGRPANTLTLDTGAINHTGSITNVSSGTAPSGDTTISAPIGSNVTGITQSSTTSRLVLSGSNAYACNLTINAGTVRISNNSNTANDVSTVSIASGGTLDLTYVGTDAVDKLVINGVEQPAGVYGKVGSSGSVTGIVQITGDGTLTVPAPEIALEQPPGTDIVNDGSQDFGSVEVGSNTSLTFTIRNRGDLALNLTGTPAVAISGANAEDFTVTADPTTPVNASGTTTFTVRFAPSESGLRSAQISIANDDGNENPFVINLSGMGQGPPEIAVEEPAGTDIPNNGSKNFGSVEAGDPQTLTFTIRNRGDLPLSLSGTPRVLISGTNAADFTVTDDPSASIDAKDTDTFTVQFSPSTRGVRSAKLSIANNDNNEDPFVINLSGSGVLPAEIAVEQPAGNDIANNGSKDFGTVGLGLNNSLTFTVRNIGDLPLNLTGAPRLVISGDDKDDFTVTARPNFAVPGVASTTFTVQFAPSASSDVGLRSAKLSIDSNDSDENPFVINLSGEAVLPPEIAVEQPEGTNIANNGSQDLGSVLLGANISHTFTIRNIGDLPLNLTGASDLVSIEGDDADDFTVTTQPNATIAADGTTTFTVQFAPSVRGPHSAKLSIANNDINEDPFVINLSGTAVLPPDIAVEQPAGTNNANNSTKDFGSVGQGLEKSLTFTIRNSGDLPLSLTGTPRVVISGTNATDFTVTTQPIATIEAAGTTTFTVKLALSASAVVGPRSAQLSIANNDSDKNPFLINLSGTAVLPPEIAVEQPVGTNIASGDTKDFGNVGLGLNNSLTFTIRNSAAVGAADLNLTGTPRVAISGANAADFTVTTQTDASVAAGATTTFIVSFAPSGSVGARSAQLLIVNDDSDENPFLINLSGTAVLPPEIAVEQPAGTNIANNGTKDFGNVALGLTNSFTFTIGNSGDLALNLSGSPQVAISGTNASDFTVTTQPSASVAAKSTTTFTVSFTPGAVGARSAKLSIANNDTNENPFVINLSGTAVLPPEIAVEQPVGTNIANNGTKDFGNVGLGLNSSLTFTISNTGDLALSLSGTPQVVISGTNSADFTVTTQPSASVAAKSTTTFVVRFAPSGVVGARSAQVSIANNDSDENPYKINLTGTAVLPPEIAVEQPAGTNIANNGTKDFGNVGLGLTNSLTFSISNSGDLPLNLSGSPQVAISGTNAADFTVTTQPDASVAAKGTTTFIVRFAPSISGVVGARSAQVSIANNDSDENPYKINLTGTAVLPPEIAVAQPVGTDIANNGPKDFGQVGLGLGRSLTFTISNSGDLPLSLSGTTRVDIIGTDKADFTVTKQPDASVAAKGITTFTVKFAPSAVLGLRSAQLRIVNDDSNENPFVINLSGEAVWPPDIAVEQPVGTNIVNGGEKNFGLRTIGSSTNLTFTVRNTGSGGLLLSGSPRVAISGDVDDFLVTSMPASYVAPGASTVFAVQFNPRAGGPRQAVLSIENNDFGDEDPFVINLIGTGTGAPDIAVEESDGTDIPNNGPKPFGNVLRGSSLSHTFTIRNKGDVSLNLTSTPRVAVSGNTEDFIVTASPSSTVAGYGSTNFTVLFAPRLAGARSAQLTIANNDSNESPFVINLSGNGTGAPEIVVEQAGGNIDNLGSQSFGTVAAGSTKGLTFTIRNEGNVTLNLGSPRVTISGTNASRFQLIIPPASTVPAGGSTNFTVQFSPGFEGPHYASLSIANDDGDENPFEINLSANSAAEIAVEGPAGTRIANNDTKDFGSVLFGTKESLSFTIRNIGGQSLNLTGAPLVEISGMNAVDFEVTADPATSVAAGGNTTFTVRFAPSALGARSASLSIANNDGNENPYVINLSGTAVDQLQYGSDNASATNYPGGAWSNGSNGGSGFGPWTIASSNGTSGFAGAFIGNPATAGITGIANPSFGLYGNPGGSGATVTVSRSFNLPLGVGDSFSFQWATNWDSDGGNKGFNIFAGGSQIVNVNQAGYPGNITFNEALAIDGSTGYGSAPMTWTFTRTTETNLVVTSTARNGSSTIAFTSSITLSSAPTGFSFYATAMGAGDERQPYFNNLQLTKFATVVEPMLLEAPANPFDVYMASFGLFDEDALGAADPDGDGQSNDAEFAFGTNPSNGWSQQTSLVNEPGSIKLIYLQHADVTYIVKSFTDLSTSFDEGGTVVTPTASNPQPAGLPARYTQYEATLSTTSDKGFLRVKAVR